MTSSVSSSAVVSLFKSSPHPLSLSEKKASQARKIEELRKALTADRPASLCEHAELLGLCRSTAWAVLNRPYKNSGLTAAVIKRMLASPKLSVQARSILAQYVAEKASGCYGHSRLQRRRFIAALSHSMERSDREGFFSETPLQAGVANSNFPQV